MRSEAEMVAHALEIQPTLLPFVPQLLADLDELGSNTELIVRVLTELGLPPSARIIDLGCGKGAVSIEIAKKLTCRVLGIDLFAPLIVTLTSRSSREPAFTGWSGDAGVI